LSGNDFNSVNTEILNSIDAVSLAVKFFNNAKEGFDLFADKIRVSVITTTQLYKNNLINARKRGIKIRFITEITKENLEQCKQLRKCVDEFRHLEGLNGALTVNEIESVGTSINYTGSVSTLIHSTEKEVVSQQQFIFNTFWKHAISYERRIREIEEGIESVKTEVLENP
jgi:two-component system, OmpR family, sensor histidine kinase VicK